MKKFWSVREIFVHVCGVCFFFKFVLGKLALQKLKLFLHSHLRNEHVHKFLFCFLVDTLLLHYPFLETSQQGIRIFCFLELCLHYSFQRVFSRIQLLSYFCIISFILEIVNWLGLLQTSRFISPIYSPFLKSQLHCLTGAILQLITYLILRVLSK